MSLFNYSFGQSCHAYYGYWTDNIGNAYFNEYSIAGSGDTIISHVWLFGDGTQSNQQNPSHHYLADGWYEVCHIIQTYDNCIDTICDSLFIPPYCFLEIYTDVDNVSAYGGSDGSITLIPDHGVPPYNYHWSTGDTVNTINNLMSGIYSATVCDGLGCCDSITIEVTQPLDTMIYAIQGKVYAGQNYLPKGILIINQIMPDSSHKALKYCFIEDGNYEIYPNQFGDYTIYAIPYVDIEYPYTPVYLPTYYGDTAFWEGADIETLDSINNGNTNDIHLIADESMNFGNAKIEGHVYSVYPNNYENSVYGQDWFQHFANPRINAAKNIPVLLLDESGNPLRFTLSDEYGQYLFDKVDTGTYYLHAEKSGYIMDPPQVKLEFSEQVISNLDLIILNHKIISEIKNEPKLSDEQITIFPNPASDNLYLNLNFNLKSQIKIMDLTGHVILEKNNDKNTDHISIDVSRLSSGAYIIQISTQLFSTERKLIIN